METSEVGFVACAGRVQAGRVAQKRNASRAQEISAAFCRMMSCVLRVEKIGWCRSGADACSELTAVR